MEPQVGRPERGLAAIHVGSLNLAPEGTYDLLARLVARRFGVPIAFVNSLDTERQWAKGRFGDLDGNVAIHDAFCAVTVASNHTVVVEDASRDERFSRTALVTGAEHVRYYAAAPIRNEDGHAIGTVAILDRTPRTLDPEGLSDLEAYAALVSQGLSFRRAMAATRESLAAFESHPQAILALDRQHRIVFMNRSACALYGVQGNPSGRPLGAVITTTFRSPEDQAACVLAADSGGRWVGEVSHTRWDGMVLHVEVSVTTTCDAAGHPTGLVLGVQDITAERRAQRLRQQLIDTADESFLLMRTDGAAEHGSVTHELIGLTGQEVMDAAFRARVHPEDLGHLDRLAATPTLPGQPHVLQWRQRTPAGTYRWLESRIGHALDHQGGIEYVMVTSRDVTGQVERGERLRLFEAAVEWIGTPILIMQTTGGSDPPPTLFVNEAFCRMTGYSRDELIGPFPAFLFGPEAEREVVGRILADLSGDGAVSETVAIYARTGATVWVEIALWLLPDAQGQPSHGLMTWRDVTRERFRLRLEQDRRAVLELVTLGRPLQDSLQGLLQLLGAQLPELRPSLLFVQDGCLHEAVPAHLPAAVSAAVNGLRIGPRVASCGRAAATGEVVITEDIATDPDWAGFQDIALGCGLRACWSVPILSRNHTVLGTFALYSPVPRQPLPDEIELLQDTARLTAVILERYHALDQSQQLALYDSLTGLPNRTLFTQALLTMLEQRAGDRVVAVGLLDLDRFKSVNDSLGHREGDRLLQQVARRLGAALRGADVCARMGGDEFTLILSGLGAAEVDDAARRLLRVFQEPFELAGQDVYMHGSLGLALCPADSSDPDDLLRLADAAMYHAKHRRLGFATVSGSTHSAARRQMQLDAALHRALERDEMRLHYQPLVEASTGRTVEVEALLRWTSPELGAVSPAEFIPVAEGTALIVPLGAWVLRRACQDIAALQQVSPGLRVAVNVSPNQFRHPGLVRTVREALRGSGLPPARLTLEITEGVLMDHHEAIRRILDLRALGVRLAIDDFGTGFSSLNYLKNLPVNAVKIDRSFVSQLFSEPDGVDAHIVRSVAHLCAGLNLELTAEGVETAGQADMLRGMGPTLLQGWHFSRDLALDKLGAWLHHSSAAR